MNKLRQKAAPALMAAAVLIIALLCWQLPGGLMARQQHKLEGQVNTIALATGSADSDAEHTLSAADTAEVMAFWFKEGTNGRYQAPSAEQLSMENAIQAARNSIADFVQMGILPDVFAGMEYSTISATMKMPSTEGDYLQQPRFGLWTVGFANDDYYISLSINAYTGQVWELRCEGLGLSLDMEITEQMLRSYIDYLQLPGFEISPLPNGMAAREQQSGLSAVLLCNRTKALVSGDAAADSVVVELFCGLRSPGVSSYELQYDSTQSIYITD